MGKQDIFGLAIPGPASLVYERLAPLFLQDLIEGFDEAGMRGGMLAAPGFLGAGVQTYTTVEDIAQDQFGVSYTATSLDRMWPFEKRHARSTLSAQSARRGGFTGDIHRLEDDLHNQVMELERNAQDLLNAGGGTADQRRTLANLYWSDVGTYWDRRNEVSFGAFGQREFSRGEPIDALDRALGEYWDTRAASTTEAGHLNRTLWDERLLALRTGWTDEEREYVQANINTRDIPSALFEIIKSTNRRAAADIQASIDARERQRERRARGVFMPAKSSKSTGVLPAGVVAI